MVLQVTVKPERTHAFTIRVDSHRILTVVTECLKQVLKSPNTKNGVVLVGFKAEDEYTGSSRLKEYPYQLFTLNIESHTFIYHLHFTWNYGKNTPRFLISFFQDLRVFVVGCDMAAISQRLIAHNQIEIRNTVDLNELTVKGMKKDDLDLGRYDLRRLTKAVLGKEMDVVWPENEVEWFGYQYRWELGVEKVKFSIVDLYLCFLITSELIDAIDCTTAGLKNKKDASAAVHEETGPSEANLFAGKCIMDPNQSPSKQVKPVTSLQRILKFRLAPHLDSHDPPELSQYHDPPEQSRDPVLHTVQSVAE